MNFAEEGFTGAPPILMQIGQGQTSRQRKIKRAGGAQKETSSKERHLVTPSDPADSSGLTTARNLPGSASMPWGRPKEAPEAVLGKVAQGGDHPAWEQDQTPHVGAVRQNEHAK